MDFLFSHHIIHIQAGYLQQRQQRQPQPATASQKNKQRTSSAWYLHTHSFHPPDQTCASRRSLLRFESIRQAFARGFFGPKAMNGQWLPQSKPTVTLTKMRWHIWIRRGTSTKGSTASVRYLVNDAVLLHPWCTMVSYTHARVNYIRM